MARKRTPNLEIAGIISHMGGSIDSEEDGNVRFTLDHIPGFARIKNETARVSFFIAWDPEPERARIFRIRLIAHGELDVIQLDDGTALRFLVTLPMSAVTDDRPWAREVAAEARELHNDWEGKAQDQGMVDSLAVAGLTMPHLGGYPSDSLMTFGPWHWGSRYVDAQQLYMFNPDAIATDIAENGHLVTLVHAGHGMNSYGLTLVTGQGPLAVFVQHGYGGWMMRPIATQMDINATYTRIATLFDATRDRRDEPCRWLLYLSDFRGAYGILDLETIQTGASEVSAGVDLEFEQSFLAVAEFGRDEESQLFSKAAELLGDVAPYNDVA